MGGTINAHAFAPAVIIGDPARQAQHKCVGGERAGWGFVQRICQMLRYCPAIRRISLAIWLAAGKMVMPPP
jgi:hypothetical protein